MGDWATRMMLMYSHYSINLGVWDTSSPLPTLGLQTPVWTYKSTLAQWSVIVVLPLVYKTWGQCGVAAGIFYPVHHPLLATKIVTPFLLQALHTCQNDLERWLCLHLPRALKEY